MTGENSAFPGWLALFPTAGIFLLIGAGPRGWANRLLFSTRPAVWIGLISYPLYLWHWPLLSFGHIIRGKTPVVGFRIAALLASFALAWLTYRYVEKHIRGAPGNRFALPLAGVMAFVFAAGLAVNVQAIPPRHDGRELELLFKAKKDWAYPDGFLPVQVGGKTFYRAGSGTATALFYGDSHVEQYGPWVTEEVCGSPGTAVAVFATSGNLVPIRGIYNDGKNNVHLDEMRAAATEYLASDEVDAVVVGGCWNCYFIGEKGYYWEEGEEKLPLSGEEGRQRALTALENELRRWAATKKVFLLLDNPIGPAFDPGSFVSGNRLTSITVRKMDPKIRIPPEQLSLRRELLALAARAGATPLDPLPVLCEGDECMVADGAGQPIYKDETHLRPFFVRERADFLAPVFTALPAGERR